MKIVNTIGNIIPKDWLFKVLSTLMNTTLTFYIFKFAENFNLVKVLWNTNDKNFIRTFLVLQILVGFTFHVIIKWLLGRIYLKFLVKQFEKLASEIGFSDLREFSKIKGFLVRFFNLKIARKMIDPKEIISLEFQSIDRPLIVKELAMDLSKWSSLLLQITVIMLFVYKYSAWYIVPLLIFTLALIVLFGITVLIFVHSIPIWEKARSEIASRYINNE